MRRKQSTRPAARSKRSTKKSDRKIRYAVVGLGHIAQAAVLAGFRSCQTQLRATTLVSDDRTKLPQLGRRYGLANPYTYDVYDECLRNGAIDAVYIALPSRFLLAGIWK